MTNDGGFDFSIMRYVPNEFYMQMTRGHVQPGDILIVKDGATTGKISYVDKDFPFTQAVVNEHVFLCRPDPAVVEPQFLFLWLWSALGQRSIRANYQGAAIGGINQTFTNTVHVPLPHLREQRRIVEWLLSRLDAVRQAKDAAAERIAALRRLRVAYLREAFTSPASKGWPRVTIGDISSLVIDGPHITPVYQPNGVPFLTIRNIVNRRIDFERVSYVSPEDHHEFARRGQAERGDILYTKDGTLGVPCLVDTDQEFSFFVSVALIKPTRESVDSRFLCFALESPSVLEQVDRLGAGAGLKHMVLKSIRALRIDLPSLSEQRSLSRSLQGKFETIEKAKAAVEAAACAIDAMSDALLREAFSGGL